MHIAIIGAGVVGQATGLGLIARGHEVTFVDINPETIAKLGVDGLTAVTPAELDLNVYDLSFVCVPTLTDFSTGIIMDHLQAATQNIGEKLAQLNGDHYPVIIYRCTMLPGTTEELTRELEAQTGLTAGLHFGVGYQPEYLRAFAAEDDFAHPRAVVISAIKDDQEALDRLMRLYVNFGAPIEVMSPLAAEFQKYVHNNGNAVMISFFNALRQLGLSLGLQPDEINQAFAVTTRTADFKVMPAYGTRDRGAYGEACLPKDLTAMIYFMKSLPNSTALQATLAFMQATQAVNISIGGQ